MSAELSVALQRCLLGGKSGAGNIQFYCSQLSVSLLSFYLVLMFTGTYFVAYSCGSRNKYCKPLMQFLLKLLLGLQCSPISCSFILLISFTILEYFPKNLI